MYFKQKKEILMDQLITRNKSYICLIENRSEITKKKKIEKKNSKTTSNSMTSIQ